MTTKIAVAMIVSLSAIISASFAELRDQGDDSGRLRKQLAGTSWKATPSQPLRGGLAPVLTFTEETVAPAGYRYDVNANDRITIHFNHGDTQAMLLSPEGQRLTFTFRGNSYAYELIEETGNLRKQLDGTRWRAVPARPLRGGLAAVLNFTAETVGPAGYRYNVNAENSITIHFNHGDTQLMLLSPNRHRLEFTFQNKNFAYELVSQ